MRQGFKFLVSMVFILGVTALPVAADDVADLRATVEQIKKDYEAKIQELEAKIGQLEQKQDQKVHQKVQEKVTELRQELKEEIKSESTQIEYVGRHKAPVGDGGVVVKNPFGFGNVSLGGYFDMEYFDRKGEESTFKQHRWIINIGAQPHERIRFNSELEIEYGGPQSPGADGEVKVEQAYADFLINDMVNLRAGAILSPFGRYNLYHDSDLQDLTDRPIMAKDVVPTTWTEAGYGLFGAFEPVIGSYEDLTVNYEAYVVNGLDAGFSDTGLSAGRNSLKTDNNDNKAFVGRVTVSPGNGHEVAASGYWGEYGSSDDVISGIGFDSLNTFGPVELITEYAYFGIEEDHAASDLANYFQGAYAQVNYHFWPEFLDDTLLGRNFSDPTFTLVGRYDWVKIDDDADSGAGINRETRYTLGLNYRPVENFVMKFEYQFNDSKNEKLEGGDGDGFVTSVALGF